MERSTRGLTILKIVGIVQARTGSKRLRNKTVMLLGNRTILGILLERLVASKTIEERVVATTTSPSDDIVERIAKEENCQVFRGSEKDVLDRYHGAATKYGSTVLVRMTADNPLTDVSLADSQVRYLIENDCDYVTAPEALLGLGSEVISFHALEESWRHSTKQHQRENVTPYIYENPEKFKIRYFEAPAYSRQKGIRLTIDYREDFVLFEALHRQFGDLVKVDIGEVIEFLCHTPEIRQINSRVRQKNHLEYEAQVQD